MESDDGHSISPEPAEIDKKKSYYIRSASLELVTDISCGSNSDNKSNSDSDND
jgi:hypothetical protein